jgi:hypothetical protein
MDKDTRIKTEIKRLNYLLKDMDENVKKAAKSLIENASFMAITLEDLQEYINLNGVTDTYQNGENQFGTKKSPQVEIYNTMVKNHSNVIKQLTELVPKQPPKSSEVIDDGFENFIKAK